MASTSRNERNVTITIDLSKVTHREFAAFWKDEADSEERDMFFQKVCGLSADEIEELPESEWREFRRELVAVCFPNLRSADEKNSAGAST